jgi:IrrE N-terminal-like domain
MGLDFAAYQAVQEFWQRCEKPKSFPRQLERSIAFALPLFVVKVPGLRLDVAMNWLRTRAQLQSYSLFVGKDRALRACLFAYGGQGIIFLDGTDPDDESRFSLAHELAHFLLDYWRPRKIALEKLGPSFAEVLDGRRPPTLDERLAGVLVQAPLQVYANLLDRDDRDKSLHPDLDSVETRADSVALELLAPTIEVWLRANVRATNFEARHQNLTTTLVETFGLPADIARIYSRSLLREAGKGPSWVERLKS